MGFNEAFTKIFDINTAIVLIFFCALVVFKMSKLDRKLLKARVFLNDVIISKTLLFISVAGASLAISALIRSAGRDTIIGETLYDFHIVELTYIVFLIAFVLLVLTWYSFISINRK